MTTSRVHYRFSPEDKALRDKLFSLVNSDTSEDYAKAVTLMDENREKGTAVIEELLEKAIRDNNVQLLDDCVARIDDINKRCFFWGRTPALLAAELDRPDCLRRLVELDCDIEVQDNDGDTVILKICGLHGNTSTLNLAFASPPTIDKQWPLILGNLDFFSCGYDINHVNKDGSNAAHVAVANNNYHLLALLQARGCDLSRLDKRGNAPIHFAVMKAMHECLEVLLKLGLDPSTPQRDTGDTPAHLAILNPGPDFEYKCLNLLVRYSADLDVLNNNSSSALLLQVTYPISARGLAEVQKARGFPHGLEVIEAAERAPVEKPDVLLDAFTAAGEGMSSGFASLAAGAEDAGSFLASPFVSVAALVAGAWAGETGPSAGAGGKASGSRGAAWGDDSSDLA